VAWFANAGNANLKTQFKIRLRETTVFWATIHIIKKVFMTKKGGIQIKSRFYNFSYLLTILGEH
jgi:hypothetical protein